MCREIISIPVYFTSFHYLNRLCYLDEYKEKWYANTFMSGGIAGVNSWLCTYPIDTLKSRKQLYNKKKLKELIKMGNLFNGLYVTLTRAFIVNGCSFYLYSKLNWENAQS
jgi:solute carrier family 25 carnitine/acylcarnitine transporter 20/29